MNEHNDVKDNQQERVIKTIFSALDGVNETLPKEKQIEKSVGTVLLGASEQVDSLGFTILIVAIEQKIEEEFGIVISLVDETTMSQEESPFRTIEMLSRHISILLKEKSNGAA